MTRVTTRGCSGPYVAEVMLTADYAETVILESVPFRTEDIAGATVIIRPLEEAPFVVDEPLPAIAPTLEEKLDTALRMLAAMQQRIESLDATLRRMLMR